MRSDFGEKEITEGRGIEGTSLENEETEPGSVYFDYKKYQQMVRDLFGELGEILNQQQEFENPEQMIMSYRRLLLVVEKLIFVQEVLNKNILEQKKYAVTYLDKKIVLLDSGCLECVQGKEGIELETLQQGYQEFKEINEMLEESCRQDKEKLKELFLQQQEKNSRLLEHKQRFWSRGFLPSAIEKTRNQVEKLKDDQERIKQFLEEIGKSPELPNYEMTSCLEEEDQRDKIKNIYSHHNQTRESQRDETSKWKSLEYIVKSKIKYISNYLAGHQEFIVNKIDNISEQIFLGQMRIEQLKEVLKDDFFESVGLTEIEHSSSGEKVEGDYLEKAQEISYKNLSFFIINFFCHCAREGFSLEEMAGRLKEHLDRVKESAYVAYHDCPKDALAIIEEGEIKTIFDFGDSDRVSSATTHKNKGFRQSVEEKMGFVGVRPVSLALGSDFDRRGPASSYGSVLFSFPLGMVEGRATATVGDSLNSFGVPASFKRWPDHKHPDRIISLEHSLVAKALLNLEKELAGPRAESWSFSEELSYVEIQYAGRPRIEQATKMTLFTKGLFLGLEDFRKYKTLSNFKKVIQTKFPNLEIEVVDDMTPELWEDYKKSGYISEINMYEKFVAG